MKQPTIYDWPEIYDWTSDGLEYDATYYTELAKMSGGPVLELGCGTGRVSLVMAREGIEVVGLDRSSQMIQHAQKKAEAMGLADRVTWIEGDMENFALDRKFPLIIIPYRSFLHLTHTKAQIAALMRIQEHLTDDGLLTFNIFVPNPSTLVSMEGAHHFRGAFPIPGTTEEIEVTDTTEYDHFHQLVYVNRYYERFSGEGRTLDRIKAELKFCYIYPNELAHLMARCNFCIQARYGTFTREPFYPDSQELIVEARKC